ncbi:carboxyl transferase domain-containing protein [Actinospongicola halichondriae]|uniref:ATP-binding protein n=1 Tax=Actinospongicola halichondriae TaxID=3236844 RepID=UPI003D56EEB6
MESFRRVAIVNRGEAAMRLVHAARDSSFPLTTIALHTQAERHAMFVREADEAVCFESLGVPIAGTPYLDLAVLEAALVEARAEAAWVGWGFVAERPEFADLCDRMGVTFIGPSGDVMRRLGDKIGAKKLAEAADVPVAPWSGGAVESVERAAEAAEAIGFPLMVKAAAGGGGRGIRRVDDASQLADAVERARSEAASSFGDATVFLERVVTDARHVEVQIIADAHGTVWAPGVRDCSLQRRNQKVIEESHSTALSPDQEQQLRDAAIRLAQESDYRNAGTVEFLYQPAEDLFAFLEVNTRLQVEHPVTEVTSGLDLVALQLHVAMGGRLEGDCPEARGHAFEARLNAEDPDAGFAPAPGRIESMVLPTGPGVRVDTGVAAGDVIAPEYDSMIAKIIAWGPTRDDARTRLRRALAETTVLVAEGTTNKSFLLDLIDRPEVIAGEIDTSWLDRLTAVDGHRTDRHADIALMVAAIDVHECESRLDRARFLSSAARGRPEADPDVGHEVELRWRGAEYRVHVATGDLVGWYRLTLDGAAVDVVLERLDEVHARLTIGDHSHRVVSQTFRAEHLVEVDGVAHRLSRDDGGLLRAPAVSLVVSLDVAPGDTVAAGQRVAVVEAMKMETAVTAPADGVVEEVYVTPNTQVDAGSPLLRIGSSAVDASPTADGTRLRFAGSGSGRDETMARIDVLRAMLLGFDLVDDSDSSVVDEHRRDRSMDDPVVRHRELELLGVFADLCGLTRERRTTDRDHGLESRSPREHFNAYLRSFDPDGESLPERFRERLHDALAHYGIESLDRTPILEAATYRIHRAAQRRREQLPVITALLERRLEHCGEADERDEVRDTLDRLIAASQARYPSIGNLARSVRHRCIDRPVVDEANRRVDADVRATLEALVEDPGDAALREHLVASAMPLMRLVGELDALSSSPDVRAALADVLTRRFYKIRALGPIERPPSAWPIVTTGYHHRDRDVRVVGVAGDLADVHEMVEEIGSLATRLDATAAATTVVDLYLRIDPQTTVHDVAAVIDLTLGSVELPDAVQRVAVVAAVSGPDRPAAGDHDVHTLTWTRHDGAFTEDVVYRGLHPMITRRLNLWRLENFDVTRLPSADDTHVFDCVAVDQPTDERLIAVAEVRDITPLRDADGTLVALPELERVLASCIDGIRQAQAADPTRQRLEWNRVMLFVWPPVEISLDEVNAVAKRLVPMTTGLGIEQVMVQGRIVDPDSSRVDDVVVRLSYQAGSGLTFSITDPPTAPMQPLDDYAQKVLQCRRRGAVYPYDLVPLLTERDEGRVGSWVELDLVDGELVPVDRAPGLNTAGVIIGEITTPTATHPDGMRRIAVFGDPTKSMGSIAEAECLRLLAAIDRAERDELPIEWFALSAGARIAMDSGSENLDWVAAVLRRIVEFTQAGPGARNREINVIVAGVNVGAQPYWNAESTMLMHTRGILVMTPDSTMVLTGKQAIDFSGGVSADDNLGIGGHERIMGPNGQAQYWAHDVAGAVDVLFAHYDHSYVAPGEAGPRRAETADPIDRDVCAEPHRTDDGGFATVGEIFDSATNPDRKKPFDIRSVMHAVVDHDHRPLERWADMAEAEGAVVYDAHLGGYPSTVIGIESRPLARAGTIPADGPPTWSAGTLFPLSSKKVARAINASSGNRPVVVLANLSGFDGSPESLRRLQLEYGAEIGRAIVNFDGPIVLCVISRYHGGAFVVFSGRLNDRMQVLAVEGAHASVIGGAPAAAVVFTREVNARTQSDERIQRLEQAIATASVHERAHLRSELASVRSGVRNEMLGVVAAEFDAIHSVERAKAVGSVHEIVRADRLRPELIAAVERGLAAGPA